MRITVGICILIVAMCSALPGRSVVQMQQDQVEENNNDKTKGINDDEEELVKPFERHTHSKENLKRSVRFDKEQEYINSKEETTQPKFVHTNEDPIHNEEELVVLTGFIRSRIQEELMHDEESFVHPHADYAHPDGEIVLPAEEFDVPRDDMIRLEKSFLHPKTKEIKHEERLLNPNEDFLHSDVFPDSLKEVIHPEKILNYLRKLYRSKEERFSPDKFAFPNEEFVRLDEDMLPKEASGRSAEDLIRPVEKLDHRKEDIMHQKRSFIYPEEDFDIPDADFVYEGDDSVRHSEESIYPYESFFSPPNEFANRDAELSYPEEDSMPLDNELKQPDVVYILPEEELIYPDEEFDYPGEKIIDRDQQLIHPNDISVLNNEESFYPSKVMFRLEKQDNLPNEAFVHLPNKEQHHLKEDEFIRLGKNVFHPDKELGYPEENAFRPEYLEILPREAFVHLGNKEFFNPVEEEFGRPDKEFIRSISEMFLPEVDSLRSDDEFIPPYEPYVRLSTEHFLNPQAEAFVRPDKEFVHPDKESIYPEDEFFRPEENEILLLQNKVFDRLPEEELSPSKGIMFRTKEEETPSNDGINRKEFLYPKEKKFFRPKEHFSRPVEELLYPEEEPFRSVEVEFVPTKANVRFPDEENLYLREEFIHPNKEVIHSDGGLVYPEEEAINSEEPAFLLNEALVRPSREEFFYPKDVEFVRPDEERIHPKEELIHHKEELEQGIPPHEPFLLPSSDFNMPPNEEEFVHSDEEFSHPMLELIHPKGEMFRPKEEFYSPELFAFRNHGELSYSKDEEFVQPDQMEFFHSPTELGYGRRLGPVQVSSRSRSARPLNEFDDEKEVIPGIKSRQDDEDHNDGLQRKRSKRALPLVYDLGVALLLKGLRTSRDLLKGAKDLGILRIGNRKVHQHEKSGDAFSALQDFRSVRPADVKIMDTADGALLRTGRVGDRKLVVKSHNPDADGQPTLEIIKEKTLANTKDKLPGSLSEDMIVYKKPKRPQ